MPSKKNIMIAFQEEKVKAKLFSEYSTIWYGRMKTKVTEPTYVGYESTYLKLNETFGNMKLTDIHPYHIESYLTAAYESGLSGSYVTKLRSMMNQILRSAEADGLIFKNPVPLVGPIFNQRVQEDPFNTGKDAFTAEEVQALYNELPKDKIGNSIRVLLASGIRMQELLALEPQHIEDGFIRICQAVKQVRGTAAIGVPKSLGSYRDVPIPAFAMPAIQYLIGLGSRFLVPGLSNQAPYNPGSYRKIYLRYISAVGVRKLPPHCCRHTYISQMQAAGVDLETIKQIVGHSKIKMTRHYLHIQDNLKKDAVNRLAQIYFGDAK